MNIAEEVKRLHELHQAGALTDAEFEAAKARLIANGPPSTSGDDFVAGVQRLRRSRTDLWLGGVCGGLGKATGMESWIWRLIFAIAVCGFGTGALIYILMWIFVPSE